MEILLSSSIQKKLTKMCIEKFSKEPHIIVTQLEEKPYERAGQSYVNHDFVFKFFSEDLKFIGLINERQYQTKIQKIREGVST